MLDNIPPAGETRPAALASITSTVSAAVVSPAENARTNAFVRAVAAPTRDLDYPVADLFGRCFLRLCLWVDLIALWRNKNQAPPNFGMGFPSDNGFAEALPSRVSALVKDAAIPTH